MRVLVTGANGFVGRALVPALITSGFNVRAAVRNPSQSFPAAVETTFLGDLGREDDPSSAVAACDAVVHLAGIAHSGPGIADEVYERVNHLGTVRLARAAEAAGVRHFVFMSSVRAQSGPTADHVLTEDDPPRPSDAYGRSKLAAEQALRAMTIPHTILRPVLIYGPGVKGNLAALAKLSALPIPLPLGGLKKQRSLLGIEGLTNAIIFALRHPATAGKTFLIADDPPLSVAEIVGALRKGFGRQPNLFSVSPRLMETALKLIGKHDAFDRLEGQLIASTAKLTAAGWTGSPGTISALAAMAPKLLPPAI